MASKFLSYELKMQITNDGKRNEDTEPQTVTQRLWAAWVHGFCKMNTCQNLVFFALGAGSEYFQFHSLPSLCKCLIWVTPNLILTLSSKEVWKV